MRRLLPFIVLAVVLLTPAAIPVQQEATLYMPGLAACAPSSGTRPTPQAGAQAAQPKTVPAEPGTVPAQPPAVSPAPTQPATATPAPGQPAGSQPADVVPGLTPVPPIAGPERVVEPVKDKDGSIDWGFGVIRVTGKAAIDQSVTNKGQAILGAERAATVDAQRKLLEIAKGVRVNGETMVEDYVLKSDIVYTQVNGLVKGARQVGSAKRDEALGIVTVDLMMNLYGSDGVADAIRPDIAPQPEQAKLDPKAEELLARYSSIVIQGAGTGAKPALFPRLYDQQGNLILDTRELVGRNARWGQGAIQFVDKLDEIMANPELAQNPLIIQVKQFQGKYLSDYVLPKDQVDILKTLKAAVPYLLKAGRFLFSLL